MRVTRSLPRRKFLTRTAITATAGLVGLRSSAGQGLGKLITGPSAPDQPGGFSLDRATIQDFAECMGSRFSVEMGPRGSVWLQLVEVKGLKRSFASRTGGWREAFSLLFRGPSELLLGQDTYDVFSPKLGAFRVLMVPVGPESEDGQPRYEVIIV